MAVRVKVIVPHEHDSADLRPIYISTSRRTPTAGEWVPALRDTVNGRRVVWARFDAPPAPGAEVWVRDGHGDHKARPLG